MKTQIYEWRQALKNITLKNCAITLLGSFILAFGLYNVHSISGVTEGGVLGATLLLEHWTGISPAFTGGIMNILCYILGWKLLGKEFIAYSALATAGSQEPIKSASNFLICGRNWHICLFWQHWWEHCSSVSVPDCACASAEPPAEMMPWP